MIAPNRVHPTAIIEGAVDLAPDVEIGALCYLRGPLIIGPGTRIYPHVIIGCEGEHRERGSEGVIHIGAGVVLRELVVVQRGTGDRETTIGDRCYVMDHCHIAHDVVLAEDVTLSPNVVLGGHTRVHRGATIGIAAATHQRSTIGAYSMVGMGSVVTKDVPPFVTAVGNPARFHGLNEKGIEAAGLRAGHVRVDILAAGDVPRLMSAEPLAMEQMLRFREDARRGRLALHPGPA
jgi:UDP-N-acetylglucosamine acyltransferase